MDIFAKEKRKTNISNVLIFKMGANIVNENSGVSGSWKDF